VKILITEPDREPVAVIARVKIPIIQMNVVSLRITIKPMINTIKNTYIMCRAVSSASIFAPPQVNLGRSPIPSFRICRSEKGVMGKPTSGEEYLMSDTKKKKCPVRLNE
jgi:hypothetical protein